MNTTRMQRGKPLLLLLLAIGLAGAVVFFPFNIENRYTCLYHRLLEPEHGIIHAGSAADGARSESVAGNGQFSTLDHHGDLLAGYLSPFGFAWWGSLALTAFAAYALRRMPASHGGTSPVTGGANQSTRTF